VIFFDFEVFKYDWLVVAIDPIKKKEYVIVNDKYELEKLYQTSKNDIWVGFNCRNYDQYILKGILCGFDPKVINDWIIVKGRKGWEFSSLFNKMTLNLFDVMPNPPVSLKTLEGFLGKNIHETSVPFDINRKLTEQEIKETIGYCRDDVLNTIEVFLKRKGEFDAQMDLLKAFNFPLSYLGKTQAQLAAVILDAKKVRFKDDWDIRLPNNMNLGKYSMVADWFLNKDNHHEDAELKIYIAGVEHTIAWGGIHAGIPKTTITCNEDEVIFDIDVGQLYPNIMRIYKLLSRAARKPEMLEHVLDTSMRLKAEGKKKEREPYKRQCNIFYGAMGDKFNPLYDPLYRTLVCVFGQVFLIDLIDKIEDIVQIINSNTDGIFFKCKKKDVPELKRRVGEWEERTHLEMEYAEYSKFISKDVNNYLAVMTNGKIHAKGAYVKDLNDLDFDLPIVNEALRNYMIFGTSVEVTINSCTDFRKFQKIVKLSNKYKWVEHESGKGTTKFDNKAYRVFSTRNHNYGRLLKCKPIDNGVKKDKFGNTPLHCRVVNDDIRTMACPDWLDRDYYISVAKERLTAFGVTLD
jgi:DNA polymerase